VRGSQPGQKRLLGGGRIKKQMNRKESLGSFLHEEEFVSDS